MAPRSSLLHNQLFVDGSTPGRGHRTNLMDPNLQQAGVGLAAKANYTGFGGNTSFNAGLLAEDFAAPGGNAFLLGVIFNDNAKTGFYAPVGEGIGNVTVLATPVGGGSVRSATTWSTGGYSLQAPPDTYNVTAIGPFGVVTLAQGLVVGGSNIELDAINPTPEPAAAGLLATAALGLLARRRRVN